MEDIHRYNDSILSEVAAVFEFADDAPPSHRYINISKKKELYKVLITIACTV